MNRLAIISSLLLLWGLVISKTSATNQAEHSLKTAQTQMRKLSK